MFVPQKFAEETGLSYGQVLHMCKTGEIEAIKTTGGHYKIPESQVVKFKELTDFISKEQYEVIVRENEKLKTIISQFKKSVEILDV